VVKRICIALLAGGLCTSAAWADLGPISVLSRQGEPFRADVTVTDAATLDLSAVHAGLASRATFNQLDVNYQPELAWLSFSLTSGDNGPVLHIRSRRPIITPNLQFVLRISGPGGSWVRAYSVGLEAKSAAPATASAPAGSAPRTLMVPPGATTAELARHILIPDVSLSRTMAALYLANRSHFAGGDPFRPRVGATLKIPDDGALHAMSAARARAILHPAAHASAPHGVIGPHPIVPPKPLPAAAAPAVKTAAAPAAKPAAAPATKPAAAPVAKPAAAPAAKPAAAPAAKPVAAPAAKPAAAPAMSASSAAALAASDAAADKQIKALQQQVDNKAQDLQKANRNIDDLKKRIHALEASHPASAKAAQSATGKALSAGFGARTPLWLIASAGGAALVLVALVLLFVLRRRRGGDAKSQPVRDTLANPLAGTGVATPDPAATGTSGNNDPLAEAEVYLAYGHDDQAEKILRAALDLYPDRQDLRAKLLEIYAARPDKVRFAEIALLVHDAYDGRGAAWERTRVMGLAIDPDNLLYHPDGGPAAAATPTELPALDAVGGEAAAADFSFDALPMLEAEPDAAAMDATAPAVNGNGNDLLDFDFSIDAQQPPAVQAAAASVIEAPPENAAAALDWPADPSASGNDLVESLDVSPSVEDEALATKLDLARVYLDMGDSDGAREVLQELLREARGTLKQQADEMLARIN